MDQHYNTPFRKFLVNISLLASSFFLFFNVQAQSYWSQQKAFTDLGPARTITKSYIPLSLDLEAISRVLHSAPMEQETSDAIARYGVAISLPTGDGLQEEFGVIRYSMMEDGLQNKFPQIQTFIAQSLKRPEVTARLDLTDHGFHAMILSPGQNFFIDPWRLGDVTHYQLYTKQQVDASAKGAFREFEETGKWMEENKNGLPHSDGIQVSSGTQRRTYRLALSATGEYTVFQGGTVSLALSAMTTTMNRVNGVYERDVAIRMTLIANTNLLIFTNGSSDPYSNGDAFSMLDENQTTVTSVIGAANYDIGHVFGTNSGGVAQLGCVCGSSKARGVTGSGAPSGDAFDIDYVAHEMGHQFGANHTFNSVTGSCSGNRASTVAYEPGSGTTIMAYAGICGADDIQPNSNDHFHFASFQEIVAFSVSGSGNSCAVINSTGNTVPTVTAPAGGFTIPKSTPFSLTATGSDANGDLLTYCWEESDLGASGAPNSPTGTAPIFRSFSPTSSPTRIFPRLSDILNNTQTLGELKPTYARTLSFKVLARDNRANGGGANQASISFSVSGTAGPFVVTAPNTSAVNWGASTVQTVTWDVAGTTASPINCQNVNILLSTDGGQTFNITLLANTPNDGSQAINVPNNPTTQARIKVEAVGNIFFDISNANFTISGAAGTVATPVISPNGGTFSEGVNVTLSCATSGAAIYYTTNGNVPQPGTGFTKVYSGPFAMTASGTVRALATKSGSVTSSTAVANFTITTSGTVATPVISPGTGTYSTAQTITITCATSGASILYTTNGNVPVSGTTYTKTYTGSFIMPGSGTIRAIASKSGMSSSAVAVANYTITSPSIVATPAISPNGGTFATPPTVTITSATSGATIYYTTNGNEPNPGTTFTKVYTGPFTISATTTVRAFGRKTDMSQSVTAVANFTITVATTVATPVITPATGSFSGPQTVSITCSTSGATIYYTTSGNNPSPGTSFTKIYSGPFLISSSATVRAMGVKAGLTNSGIVASFITITGGRSSGPLVEDEESGKSSLVDVPLGIWPNPGNGLVTLSKPKANENPHTMLVKNALGVEVFRSPVIFKYGKVDLNLSHLRDGIYFIEVQQEGDKPKLIRMIKQ